MEPEALKPKIQLPRLNSPESWLILHRTVRFGETDAAGVMHFQQLLRWCHEAYEESLERFGINAATLFPTPGAKPAAALPIIHCSADYRRPVICGDRLTIRIEPHELNQSSFELHYYFNTDEGEVARALTRHLAIDKRTRQRRPLPEAIQKWLEASSDGQEIQEIKESQQIMPAPAKPTYGTGSEM